MTVKITMPPTLTKIEFRQWCVEQAVQIAAKNTSADVVHLAAYIEQWVTRMED